MKYTCEKCGVTAETNVARCFLCETMGKLESQTMARDKIAICRSNKCGHYVAANDACQLVIDRGKAKGQNRPGKIVWMYGNPAASCPADPPQF